MTSKASRLSVLGVSVAIVAAALGCATSSPEVDLPPQTLTEAATSTAEEETALVSPERAPQEPAHPDVEEVAEEAIASDDEPDPNAALAARKHTVVIQGPEAGTVTPRTLQQASESERERRASATAPVAVITNQNLSDLAAGGQISIVSDGSESTAAVEAATAAGAPATGSPATAPAANNGTAAGSAAPPGTNAAAAKPSAALTEEYWRAQALKIRLDWKAAVEEIELLQGDVADLRRRFYEEDDPFYRDNEIKPAWDRAIDRLQEAKAVADAQERKLDRFLDDGRRSGALPGWLREGVEFEPPATPDRTPAARRRTDDPWEPKVLEEEPRDP